MLARVDVEHEVGQSTFQTGSEAPVDGKARTGKFGGSCQIKHAKLLTDFPMRLGCKSKLWRRAPAAHFHIGMFVVADRHAVLRQVGDATKNVAHGRVFRFGLLFQFLDLVAHRFVLLDQGGGILFVLLEPRDFLRGPILIRLKCLRLVDGLAAAAIEFAEVLKHRTRIHSPLAQLFFHQLQLISYEAKVKHGNIVNYFQNVSLASAGLYALLLGFSVPRGLATAYEGRPKLVVMVIIDQLRGDLLERYQREFGERGFKQFLVRGANFTECNYGYANTRTAPGHATLMTGAYTDGHGILANEWWDAAKKRSVTSVEDESVRLLGSDGIGSSPHNLLADTLGDELKLATQGRARVFALALKDRAAALPGGFSANYAFWIDHATGRWVSSSYYAKELPSWVNEFNGASRAEKYWDLDWKSADGRVLRWTRRDTGKTGGFYEVIGATPFANDYELEFARELVLRKNWGPARLRIC